MVGLRPMYGGIIVPTKNVKAMYGGVLTQAKSVRVMKNGVLTTVWENEIVATVAASVNNLNIQTLFTAAVWASATPKRVVINSGVNVGSTNTAVAALRTGTGRGGPLVVVNNYNILGASGAANGGVGGDAFHAEQACTLINNYQIFAGGGGGAKGGNGGPGYYTYEVDSGWGYNASSHRWFERYTTNSNGDTTIQANIYWNGSFIANVAYGSSSFSSGGYTYYKGAAGSASGGWNYYYIRRTYPATAYTSGGLGGNGGRGQGFDGGAANGAYGAAGGTNAGAGGTGGSGGGWGANGAAGASGAGGNNGAGTGGGAGGLAGFSLKNSILISLTNSGSLAGRT